jgi:hypothetical protein
MSSDNINLAPHVQRTVGFICLGAGAAFGILFVALAILYGTLILYGLAIIAGIFVIRFGVMPILKSGAEIADQMITTRMKVIEHKVAMEQSQRFVRIQSNEIGNYDQIIDAVTGQLVTYIQPGNAPVAQITMPRNYREADASINVIDSNLSNPQPPVAFPSVEQFYEKIPFNSLQTGLGAHAGTGELIVAPIRKSTHFKLIGGSGQGKSCVAGAILDIATTTNDPDHLKIGLLDLEHNTSRLFENLPHIAEIGPKRQRLIGRDADEVAQKFKLLQWELQRRSELGETYCTQHEPVLLVYVEEMLALKYEVVDTKLKKEMLAAFNILAVRGRKYGIFFLACMQTDYSDKTTREAMAQFRTRGGFAIDPETARASGFFDTELVKQNFQAGRPGQYVLEKPQFSSITIAPDYDVAAKLERLEVATNNQPDAPYILRQEVDPVVGSVVAQKSPTTGALEARSSTQLTPQEWRIIEKWRDGMGLKAIIGSEFTNSKGEPLTGGDLFTQKAREIQTLIARFLPSQENSREAM